MLSKSQAKTFFLLGTAVCSAIFVGLTIDTFTKIPAQTNQNEMNDSVVRGKHLFDQNNCMGCHTIMGEGAYYAPELTKVIDRRGEAFVKAVLADPDRMFPGQRRMVNYKFTEDQINDLTAFLTWIGKMDLNGFPAKPDLMQTTAASAATTSTVAQPKIFAQMCTACHMVAGIGGNVGPALDGIGSRRDAEFLKKWLINPMDIKADSKMPKMPLSDKDIEDLTAYLSELKEIK